VREEADATGGETLIYAAISGPRQEREPLIRLLRPVLEEFPDGYKVVMSMGDPDGGSNPVSSGNLTAIPWVLDRYEYLKACDLVVCRGGHNTIMQCISYGKPSILIPTPNHTEQYANARRAAELGFSVALHQVEFSRDLLFETVNAIIGDGGYNRRLEEFNLNEYSDGIENTLAEISILIA
jgi:uncharacterized protein (TIGR00661 family)